MKSTAWIFVLMLTLTVLPTASAAQEEPSPDDLALRQHLESLFGLVPLGPQDTSGFCKPGAGCFPVYVDEAGDTMTGPLNLLDTLFFPLPDEQDQMGPLSIADGSFVRFDEARLHMPIDFSNELRLLEGAVLNATAGGVIFIDHDGNLSFADGSWFRNGLAHWFSNITFDGNVSVRGAGNHLFVTDGATLVTDNLSGFLSNGIGRIGTLDFNPLHLIVNNTTAFLLVPGTSPNLIGGHADNAAGAQAIGVIIAGGGAAGQGHNATGDFAAILGGLANRAAGDYATVIAGRDNDALGVGSAAAGQRAKAEHDGTFVWADGQNADFTSTTTDQFLVRAQNGLGINTPTTHSALTVAGDITPATNDMYALGSPTHRWDQLFMASEVDYASDLLYTSGGTLRATLTTTGDFQVSGRFLGDGSALTGVVATGLADGSVDTADLQNAAVTGDKIASGAVGNSHLAQSAVGSGNVVDGSITTDKLADGAVTTPKLADGAVTASKLGISCAQDQILKQHNGTWICAADQGVESLGWDAITAKPAGFADDLDDDTTYTAGDGIVLTGTMFSLLGCSPGEVLKVKLDGTWACAADADAGGDITDVLAGTGLTGGGTSGNLTLSVDTTTIQRRVTGDCGFVDSATGASVKSINADGTVACDIDDDTKYANGAGLDLVGTTFSVNTTQLQSRVNDHCDMLDSPTGGAIKRIEADGNVFCDLDDDTTYSAGTALQLSGTTFSLLPDGVTSDHIQDGTIKQVDVDAAQIQVRVGTECAAGNAIRAIDSMGQVTCQSVGAADTLDGLDSAQFLRSDASDTFTGSELTVGPASALNVSGTLKSDLIPHMNDVYMLGNDTHRYSDLWLGSAIHHATPLEFESGGRNTMTLQTNGDLDLLGRVKATTGVETDALRLGPNAEAALTWDTNTARITVSDDLEVTGGLGALAAPLLNYGGNFGAGTALSSGYGAVRGAGVFGPTNGYLGAQGGTDFDGVTSADWAGREIGVAGISTGGSITDNYGVMGHSNHVGVRGEYSGNPTADYGQLGMSGVGIRAAGTSLAGEFLGDISVSDQILLATKLIEVLGGQLHFDGNAVCTNAGNCAGMGRLVATNDVRLGSVSESSSGSAGSIVGATGVDVTPTLRSLSAVSMCFIDFDGDAAYDSGEPLYLNVDADACGDTVETGDLRLVATAGQAAFTKVSPSHSDFGQPLTDGAGRMDAGLEDGGSEVDFADLNGDGLFAAGDCLYADIDGSGQVSTGDYRWTACAGSAAGTIVTSSSTDLGLLLAGGGFGSFALDTAAAFWDSLPNDVYDSGDVLYLDISEG